MAISEEKARELEIRFKKTEKMIERLKSQKGLKFHILSKAIEDHRNIDTKYKKDISHVRKLNSEVGQFKQDVKSFENSGNTKSQRIVKKLAYEDDEAVKDLKNAAKAVEQIESLREESIERGKDFGRQGNTHAKLVMLNHQLVFEIILRELLHYLWDSYSELRVMSLELQKKTGYDIFKKEISNMSDDSDVENAINILKDRYKGPESLEKYRDYQNVKETVEKKIRELEDKL